MDPATIVSSAATGVLGGVSTWLNNKKNEELMRESWEREDTAVQRRVADLEAAGLNKVLAAGQGAQASGPIQVNDPAGGARESTAEMVNLMRAKADIAKTNADAQVSLAQARKVGKEAQLIEETFDPQKSRITAEAGKAINETWNSQIKSIFEQWWYGAKNPTGSDGRETIQMVYGTGFGDPAVSPAARKALAEMEYEEAMALFRSVYAKIMDVTGGLPGGKTGIEFQAGKHKFSAGISSNVQYLIMEQLRKALGW